ncbi:MAG: Holliday junction resolvase RuvX [Actinomycetota bacterium]|jgi:putative Holliday junction resolvase
MSDQAGLLATPFSTVYRLESLEASVKSVLEAVSDYYFLEIYVGHPLNLQGSPTASTTDALNFAFALRNLSDVPIRMVDERLSTVSASANLRNHGISSKNQRKVIDQEAAAIILEGGLSIERNQQRIPGRSLDEFERPAAAQSSGEESAEEIA